MTMDAASSLSPALSSLQTMPNLSASGVSPRPESAKQLGRDFESLILSQLVKQLRASVEGGLFKGEGSDTYGAMFDQYLSEYLADNGGLGLADYLEKSLQKAVDEKAKTAEQLDAFRPLSLRRAA